MYVPYFGAKKEREILLGEIFESPLFLEKNIPLEMLLKSVAPGYKLANYRHVMLSVVDARYCYCVR